MKSDVASPHFRLPAGYTPSVHALVDPLDADPAERPRRKRISTQVEQCQEHGAEHIPSAAKVGMEGLEGHEPFKWLLGKSSQMGINVQTQVKIQMIQNMQAEY